MRNSYRQFVNYEWDKDERWKEQLRNTDFPEGRNEDEILMRMKLRYYKKYINPQFDPYAKEDIQSSAVPEAGRRVGSVRVNSALHLPLTGRLLHPRARFGTGKRCVCVA